MNRIITTLIAFLFITNIFAQADDRPENTGDNFSLEGALALFKKSGSLEEFEKMLNEENNNVNNLDLNNDGDIDYIVVNDIAEGDAHAIVLSVYLSEKEKQDIATIGIEKVGAESAKLQIEGDADLYPENTIVEPKDDGDAFVPVHESTKSYSLRLKDDLSSNNFNELTVHQAGRSINTAENITAGNHSSGQVFVNVWFWPGVRYVYAPGYMSWRSPWRWGLYPKWWRPWRPHGFGIFYGRSGPYRVHFHRVPTRRVIVARGIYAPRRSRSTLVIHNNRRATTIIKKNPRGRVKAVKVKRGRGRRF